MCLANREMIWQSLNYRILILKNRALNVVAPILLLVTVAGDLPSVTVIMTVVSDMNIYREPVLDVAMVGQKGV